MPAIGGHVREDDSARYVGADRAALRLSANTLIRDSLVSAARL